MTSKTTRKAIDWEAVEGDYRAGLLSLREMSESHGVSHVMIAKKAKALGWVRDLNAKIQARADALVNASVVTGPVNSLSLVTERQVIEANAERIAQVRGEHRADITRMRALVIRLLAECEAEAADPAVFAEMGEMLRQTDEKGQDRLNDAYQKAISLPVRIKGVKDLADALKALIGMEREAYDIGGAVAPADLTDPRTQAATLNDIARRMAFVLASGLKPAA